MRKVHRRVVLDVFTVEDESEDLGYSIHDAIENIIGNPQTFPHRTGCDEHGNKFEIQDIQIESIEITDSR